MRTIFLAGIFALICFSTFSQEKYYENENEKGYGIDGQKVGYWEYFDSDGNLLVKFNHNNGRLAYLKPDSSSYFIKKNSEWIAEKLKIYPVYLGGEKSYFIAMAKAIDYPLEARRQRLTGTVYISFVIDSLGVPGEFIVENDICEECSKQVLMALKGNLGFWIPAQKDGVSYSSKFIQPVTFKLDGVDSFENNELKFPGAKLLSELVVVGYGTIQKMEFNNGKFEPYGAVKMKLTYEDQPIFRNNSDKLPIYTNMEEAIKNKEQTLALNFSHSNLKYIPLEVKHFKKLYALSLENNLITSFSDELSENKELKELFLDRNSLESLPSQIKQLKELNFLSVSENKLSEFPLFLTEMESLKILNLGKNKIKTLPEEIGKLQNLEILAIYDNQITELPEAIYNLKNLKELIIDYKKISKEARQMLKNRLPNLIIGKE